ncbi:MAG: RNA polymerase sporulation sigma factor SigG [Firmicutes bacterium]|nr:RNA polymerase sporulation sigma factor SigG [Bacillota bacterium]MCL1954016.1 RNA polymerase sporulation sigma factor SigG [Bacillota bacterium]
MNNRVVICGIDTANLPKITHKETIELIKLAKTGDEKAREQFLMSNMRLVLSIVQRFGNKKEAIDDIFQVGCIGLIKAMQNFNTEYNLRFSTYAVPMIIGEIRRYLRDNSAVRISRSIRDNAYKVLQARQALETGMDREASLEEIAATIDLSVKEVVYCLDAISDPVSIFDPVYHDDGDTVMVMDQLKDHKNIDENWLSNVNLSDAINKLSPREKEILMLRFFEGKTQIEVSREVGISQAQVSRLEKNAIADLQKNI